MAFVLLRPHPLAVSTLVAAEPNANWQRTTHCPCPRQVCFGCAFSSRNTRVPTSVGEPVLHQPFQLFAFAIQQPDHCIQFPHTSLSSDWVRLCWPKKWPIIITAVIRTNVHQPLQNNQPATRLSLAQKQGKAQSRAANYYKPRKGLGKGVINKHCIVHAKRTKQPPICRATKHFTSSLQRTKYLMGADRVSRWVEVAFGMVVQGFQATLSDG
jgi:hypothetical protein